MLKFTSFTRRNPNDIIRKTYEEAHNALTAENLEVAKTLFYRVVAKASIYPDAPDANKLAAEAKNQLRSIYQELGDEELFCWA